MSNYITQCFICFHIHNFFFFMEEPCGEVADKFKQDPILVDGWEMTYSPIIII